jgi:hypothetical protein
MLNLCIPICSSFLKFLFSRKTVQKRTGNISDSLPFPIDDLCMCVMHVRPRVSGRTIKWYFNGIYENPSNPKATNIVNARLAEKVFQRFFFFLLLCVRRLFLYFL